MKSVDAVYALLDYRPTPTGPFDETNTPRECIHDLCKNTWRWNHAIRIWKEMNPREDQKIKFRASCKRGGQLTKQFGGSPDIASAIGSHIFYMHSWEVNLVDYDIDVYLHLNDNDMVAGIYLSSPSHRKMKSGRGLLKPPVAYCMGQIAEVKEGEIIMDPMCGTAMILVEAAEEVPAATYIGIYSDLN